MAYSNAKILGFTLGVFELVEKASLPGSQEAQAAYLCKGHNNINFPESSVMVYTAHGRCSGKVPGISPAEGEIQKGKYAHDP